ncbi:hypothetical protein P3L10_016195 [Capsicum annuum]
MNPMSKTSCQLKKLTKGVPSAKKVDKNTLKFSSGVIRPRKVEVCRSTFDHSSRGTRCFIQEQINMDFTTKMFHFDQSELNSSESNEMNLDYDFVSLDKWDFNVIPLQHQSNVDETKKISGSKLPSAFKILKEYDTIRFKRSKTDKKIITNSECIKLSVTDKKIITNSECIKLSVDEILRLGAEKFIQSCTIHGDREAYMLFASSFLGLSEDDTRNVALVENLLASAEKVSQKQYDRARRILNECDKFCSNTGNPVHRLAYYFSQALRDRIDRDAGRDSSKDIGMNLLVPMEHLLMNLFYDCSTSEHTFVTGDSVCWCSSYHKSCRRIEKGSYN